MVFNIVYNNFNCKWNIKMTMQDILIELSDYDVNCQVKNGFFVIGVSFNENWQVLEPMNSQIEFTSHNGMWYYGASLKEVTFDEVFQCIQETIEHNKDLERRLILFKEKVEELRRLFKEEEVEKLKTLEFTFKTEEETKRTEKKSVRKKNKPKEKVKKETKAQKEEKITESQPVETEEFKIQKNMSKAVYPPEPISVDDGVVFVDTIAEMSGNKVNQNNYLKNTD